MKRILLLAAGLFLIMPDSTATADELRAGVYRTPDERFENLDGFDYPPHYLEIGGYRVHYVDAGPSDGPVVLLMHGEPSWSYLYRKMIPILTKAGYRAIAPDLVGFGRSDKPAKREDHSYQMHVDVMTGLVKQLDLTDITLFCQDWGSLIGLRVAAENEERFARIVLSNGGLPAMPGEDGSLIGGQFTEPDPEATLDGDLGSFPEWLKFSQTVPEFMSGYILQAGTITELSDAEMAAYDAPFPDARFKAGPRVMPTLVMSQIATNREAWKVFENWEKPFLTAFSDSDPITRGGDVIFHRRVPGAKNQPHVTIEDASHFVQEDKGEELAHLIVKFIESN